VPRKSKCEKFPGKCRCQFGLHEGFTRVTIEPDVRCTMYLVPSRKCLVSIQVAKNQAKSMIDPTEAILDSMLFSNGLEITPFPPTPPHYCIAKLFMQEPWITNRTPNPTAAPPGSGAEHLSRSSHQSMARSRTGPAPLFSTAAGLHLPFTVFLSALPEPRNTLDPTCIHAAH
jgi:hypothetical protein